MYSVLLSEYENGMKLVEKKLKSQIKEDYKAVIIAWTFPLEIDKKSLMKNGSLKVGEDMINMLVHY